MNGAVRSTRRGRYSNAVDQAPRVDAAAAASTTIRPLDPTQCSHQPQYGCAAAENTAGQGQGSVDPSTFAARLNQLFDTVRPPGRGPLRNHEVIKALHACGIEMSAPYLSQLRAGSRRRPRQETMRQLADFFGVSIAYFTEVDSAYTRYLDDELRWLEMAHDPEVRWITTALLALSPDAREAILESAGLSDNR